MDTGLLSLELNYRHITTPAKGRAMEKGYLAT
jgi:hypothetical protein